MKQYLYIYVSMKRIWQYLSEYRKKRKQNKYFNMLCLRFLHRKYPITRCVPKRNKYYVLLPEIPDVTPENNPLLRTNSFPPFSEITTENCANALKKLTIEYESGIHHLGEKLYDPNIAKTVENVIVPLDRLTVPMEFCWATFKLLYTLGVDDSLSNIYNRLCPRILRAKREQYMSLPIYHAFKELKVDERLLSEPVQRIINKHLLESQLSGIDLADRQYESFKGILIKLNSHKANYRSKLMNCTAKFSQPLTMNEVHNFPKDFLSQISGDPSNPLNGPWYVTFSPTIYRRFMEHCENRMMRWNVWHAKNIRASAISGQQLNNSIEIEEIRNCRLEQAKAVGYSNFVDLSMKTKMAGNVDNVLSMITTLRMKSRAAMLKEIDDLQDFAAQQGFGHSLQLWDIPFWQRKHKEHLFGVDEHAIKQYFPFPTVLKGVFEFCHKLFGITIIKGESSIVETWHDDASFYKILDHNGTHVASFYLDPYSRPNEKAPGAQMEIGQQKSDVCGTKPLSYLIFNFSPPQHGKPSLLSFNDMSILLQKFGHVLQHSLTIIPYSDVAGISSLEWDVVQVCPIFMSSWLSHYKTTASLSSHVETGCKLPEEKHMAIVKSQQYMSALQLNEELYLSALDLELYSSQDFWVDVMKRLWLEFIPFPIDKYQAHVCSFPQIFCDEFPAAYFSLLWAEMIAADIFSAFKEVGLDNEEGLQVVGQRFRETYLSLGGGCHPNEVFRRFRGRDPSIDALLSRYGISQTPFTVKKSSSAES